MARTLRKRVTELEVEVEELTKDVARAKLERVSTRAKLDDLTRRYDELSQALYPLVALGRTNPGALDNHVKAIPR